LEEATSLKATADGYARGDEERKWLAELEDRKYIKKGSIEDLANEHYGRVGREKENADREYMRKKYQN